MRLLLARSDCNFDDIGNFLDLKNTRCAFFEVEVLGHSICYVLRHWPWHGSMTTKDFSMWTMAFFFRFNFFHGFWLSFVLGFSINTSLLLLLSFSFSFQISSLFLGLCFSPFLGISFSLKTGLLLSFPFSFQISSLFLGLCFRSFLGIIFSLMTGLLFSFPFSLQISSVFPGLKFGQNVGLLLFSLFLSFSFETGLLLF